MPGLQAPPDAPAPSHISQNACKADQGFAVKAHFILRRISHRLASHAQRLLRLTLKPDAWRALPRNLWPPSRLRQAIGKAQRFLDADDNSPEARQKRRTAARKRLLRHAEAKLAQFLSSGSRLVLPRTVDQPGTTIVLVLHNKAALTHACLRSIADTVQSGIEVIIVDNNSTDETRAMLGAVAGAKVILNDENRHFLLACNQAAEAAEGEYLLFLNNDAQLLPGSLDAALRVIRADSRVGAVGGKILLPDGTLQEAGSIVWQDGSCLGYGRGDDPDAPEYNFRREVDYCSGAFLLTPRHLFRETGGFDAQFAPAYYEETDYCLRLHALGYRVIYEPDAIILHYEFGSASADQASALMAQNQQRFVRKHGAALSRQWPRQPGHVIHARARRPAGPRILYVDDQIPHAALGSGFPRANRILWGCVELGAAITFLPTVATRESWEAVYRDLPREAEIILGGHAAMLAEFIRQRPGYYDIILISRPHNMARLRQLLEASPELPGSSRLVYDAEAIFALREFASERIKGMAVTPEMAAQRIRAETDLAAPADAVIAVSEAEAAYFTADGRRKTHVLQHMIEPTPTGRPFGSRNGMLFVGPLDDESSPNVDSMIWFAREVLPRIRAQLPGERMTLVMVGSCGSARVRQLQADDSDIVLTGRIDDATSWYDQARLFVAPTRFAAGIPLKIYGAAAHGVPVVATQLLCGQLGWTSGQELLTADAGDPVEFANQCVRLYQDEDLWGRTRALALQQVTRDCSSATFNAVLRQVLTTAATD